MATKKLQIVGSQLAEGAVTRQRVQLNQIKVGPRPVTCSPEEAERLYQSEGLEQMSLKIAVTTSLRLVEGAKALAACRLKGLQVVEVFILSETPALAEFVKSCRTLASQLTPLQLILECRKAYDSYVAEYPETKRGSWLREERSDCAYRPSFAVVTSEAAGRSVRWVQEAVSAGHTLAPEVAEVVLASDPRAERKSILRFAKLNRGLQTKLAETVGRGETTLKEALQTLDETASDEGAKYARAVNRMINLLPRLEGLGDYLDHPTVSAARERFRQKARSYLVVLTALPEQLLAPLPGETSDPPTTKNRRGVRASVKAVKELPQPSRTDGLLPIARKVS